MDHIYCIKLLIFTLDSTIQKNWFCRITKNCCLWQKRSKLDFWLFILTDCFLTVFHRGDCTTSVTVLPQSYVLMQTVNLWRVSTWKNEYKRIGSGILLVMCPIASSFSRCIDFHLGTVWESMVAPCNCFYCLYGFSHLGFDVECCYHNKNIVLEKRCF